MTPEPIHAKCPICAKPRVHAFRPFCSKRCADLDLGRWLKGSYAITEGCGGDDGEEIQDLDPTPTP